MNDLPPNAMCETDLLRTAPADPAAPTVPHSRKGLTVRAVSTRTSCERSRSTASNDSKASREGMAGRVGFQRWA